MNEIIDLYFNLYINNKARLNIKDKDVNNILFIIKFINNLNLLIDDDVLLNGSFYYEIKDDFLIISREYNIDKNEFILTEE